MNALMLKVIAARVEGRFPGEAEDLRRIAITVQKMERTLNELVAEECEQANLAEEEQIKQEDEAYMNRRKSRMIMQAWNRLEQRIKDGVILPDYDAGADLQRICQEWANR
jgi:hypothetical protein